MHAEDAKAAGVTVIRRFSGGGTVAVDSDTVFATLISDDQALPEVSLLAKTNKYVDDHSGIVLTGLDAVFAALTSDDQAQPEMSIVVNPWVLSSRRSSCTTRRFRT